MIVGATGAGLIARLKSLVLERPSAPVTRMPKLNVPEVLGVPLRTPPLDRLTPAGKLPEANVHV